MGDIHNHGCAELLHLGNISEIHDHIAVAEHISTIREHHTVIAAIHTFLHGVFHGIWAGKLTLLDIYPFPGARCCRQQLGLTEQKRWNLQYINILRRHRRFMRFMNIGHRRNPKMRTYFGQNLQGLFISDTRK